ncbi:MAG: response regulator [Gemmatimonadales bacterium]
MPHDAGGGLGVSALIRLLVADDHPVVREGLKRLVGSCPDMEVVAEAVSGDQVLPKVDACRPDVLLLDVSMPGAGFLELMGRLRSEQPRVRVLILSVYPEDQFAVRAFKAGAVGYLNKDRSPEELIRAIRRVDAGGRYVTASLAEKLAFDLGPDMSGSGHEALSTREYEVLLKLGSGLGVKETAAELSLSPKTVSTYRARILAKMDLRTNADMIRYVIERRLLGKM